MNAIAALAGMILSLSFRYIPGLKGWFERLSSEGKSGIMAIMIVIAGIGTAIWQCSTPDDSMGHCLSIGWKEYARAILSALVTNQATHQITPKEKSV